MEGCAQYGTAVGVADVMTLTIFGDRLRGVDSVGGRKFPFPIQGSRHDWSYSTAQPVKPCGLSVLTTPTKRDGCL